MQCSRLTRLYIYIYIYLSHFNCVGAVSVVSSSYYKPRSTGLTTRRSRRDRARVEMEQARATWYWSDLEAIDMLKRLCESRNGAGAVRCKRDRARECKRKQRDIASEESKATALPSSPLLTCGYLLAYFCARHTLHMRIPSLCCIECEVYIVIFSITVCEYTKGLFH